jgi:hypothetical protein
MTFCSGGKRSIRAELRARAYIMAQGPQQSNRRRDRGYRTLIPEIRNIQMMSQIAIAATTI